MYCTYFVGDCYMFMCLCVSPAHLEGDFEEMESRLVYLETLCCQCEQQTSKQNHIDQLEVYKKKKRYEMHITYYSLVSYEAELFLFSFNNF